MRNPLTTNQMELTDKEKEELTRMTEHLAQNYMVDMAQLSSEMFGNEGGATGYLMVASLITMGYALKTHEIENLEYDLLQRAVEKPDAN